MTGVNHSIYYLINQAPKDNQMTLSVDVIIPTWNSAKWLERVLQAVEEGAHPARIIIVDRDSVDGTQEIARAHGCTIILDTISLGSARTKGIRASNTDWILFVDDDVIIPPDFIERMEEFMDKATGALWSPCVSTKEPLRSTNISQHQRAFGEQGYYLIKPGERGFTNATLIRRELIRDLDISDLTTWEDWAIAQRVMESGMHWKVVRVFSDHIHDDKGLFYKTSWNTAGILNLGRTGRKTVRWALSAYAQHLRLYAMSAFREAALDRDAHWCYFYLVQLSGALYAPRHLIGTRKRR